MIAETIGLIERKRKKKMRICNNTIIFYGENATLSCLLMIDKRGKIPSTQNNKILL